MRDKLDKWEALTDKPLMAAAILFFVAFAVPIVWWPDTPTLVVNVCEVLVWATWAVFVVDFVARLMLADDRLKFLRRHWFDLLVIALPVLRPLRLLRLVTFLSLLNRRASTDLRGRVTAYVAGGATLLAVVGALAVVDAERDAPGANILTIGDAFWWAATTMTTVGYGDRYPITAIGRAVAVGLMVSGIAILGTVTATLASWIVERVDAVNTESDVVLVEVQALRAEVQSLRQELRERQTPLNDGYPHGAGDTS